MLSHPILARGRRTVAGVMKSPRSGPVMTLGLLALAAIIATSAAALARPAPESFADLVEQVAPAVVTVSSLHKAAPRTSGFEGGERHLPFPPGSPFPEFFERHFDRDGLEGRAPGPSERRATGVGSGFIMDPDGTIVTNNHVVEGAEKIEVTLKDGRTFEAELIGRDEKTDLALLKIESDEPLATVAFGDSDRIRVGDWVMAIGNPFGLGGTVTAGIVSARGRDLAGGTLIDFLQIDAAINRGNSGGPAFNTAGEVIGINTAIYSPNGGSIGIGFAIPANLAKQVVAQLREHGTVERGWLGVRIQPVTPELAEGLGLEEAKGALVASVEGDGPAATAGLEAGDVILGWDGHEVVRFKDLPRLVAATPAEQKVEVKLWRNRKAKTLSVTTGRMPGEQRRAALGDQPRKASGVEEVPGTGLVVSDLTPALRARFGIDEAASGVLITGVDGTSAAAERGLKPGDVIESIGLAPISSASEAVRKIEQIRESGQDVVMVLISRQGATSFFALRLAEA